CNPAPTNPPPSWSARRLCDKTPAKVRAKLPRQRPSPGSSCERKTRVRDHSEPEPNRDGDNATAFPFLPSKGTVAAQTKPVEPAGKHDERDCPRRLRRQPKGKVSTGKPAQEDRRGKICHVLKGQRL